MSLILDALKRAERERQVVPDEEHRLTDIIIQNNGASKIASTKINQLLLGLVIILIIIVLVVWYSAKPEKQETVAESLSIIDRESVKPPDNLAYSSAANQIVKPESLTSNMTQAVTDLYQHSNASTLPKVEEVQVAQLYTEKSPEEIESESIAVTNPLPDANEQLPVNLQTAPDIRRIVDLQDVISFDELSYNQKKLFPSINYSQHNYLGNSASSVVINGVLMRAGSRISPDLSIEEVLEDGILLKFYNRQVTFKALNGWINM